MITDSDLIGVGEGTPYSTNVIDDYAKTLSLARKIQGLSLEDTLDILRSSEGDVTETTVRHSAYPFPIVPLEYALASLMSGLDPVWTSVVMGLLYLLHSPLMVFLLSRMSSGFLCLQVSFHSHLTPLVVTWLVWYNHGSAHICSLCRIRYLL